MMRREHHLGVERVVAEPHSPLGVLWHPQRAKDLFIFSQKLKNNNNNSKDAAVYEKL